MLNADDSTSFPIRFPTEHRHHNIIPCTNRSTPPPCTKLPNTKIVIWNSLVFTFSSNASQNFHPRHAAKMQTNGALHKQKQKKKNRVPPIQRKINITKKKKNHKREERDNIETVLRYFATPSPVFFHVNSTTQPTNTKLEQRWRHSQTLSTKRSYLLILRFFFSPISFFFFLDGKVFLMLGGLDSLCASSV